MCGLIPATLPPKHIFPVSDSQLQGPRRQDQKSKTLQLTLNVLEFKVRIRNKNSYYVGIVINTYIIINNQFVAITVDIWLI